MSLSKSENTRNSQELLVVCINLTSWPGRGNRENSELILWIQMCTKRAGMASPPNVRYPLLFFQGKGTLTERGSHSWSLWSSSHSSSLVTKLLSPLFYHGSDKKHCKHRKQRKWCNPQESPCHQGGQPGCGSAQGHHQHWWQMTAIPLGSPTWTVYVMPLLTVVLQPQNVAGKKHVHLTRHVQIPTRTSNKHYLKWIVYCPES